MVLVIEHAFAYLGHVLTTSDLATPHAAEQARRSVAMLSTNAWAANREDALLLIETIRSHPQYQPGQLLPAASLPDGFDDIEVFQASVERMPSGADTLRRESMLQLLQFLQSLWH